MRPRKLWHRLRPNPANADISIIAEPLPMNVVMILLGIGLLTLGRKLFWLFVAAFGFIAGIWVATHFFADQREGVSWTLALIGGGLGAVLALFVQKGAVAVGGFLAGGFLAVKLLEMYLPSLSVAPWLPFVAGGVIGIILMSFIFEWALMVLSSLAGAILVADAIGIHDAEGNLITFVIFVVGLLVQIRLYRGKEKGKG